MAAYEFVSATVTLVYDAVTELNVKCISRI